MVVTFKLLYTGFLPFVDAGNGTREPNPSGEGAVEMGRRRTVEVAAPQGVTLVANIVTRVFDVLWSIRKEDQVGSPQTGAADLLERAIDDERPDIVIATGMSGANFKIEHQAEDVDGHYNPQLVTPWWASPDNNNRVPPAGRREFPNDPVHRDTTLPVQRILDAWRKAGVTNVEESYSAGNFICEDVFYRLMRVASDRQRMLRGLRIHRAGFCHTPSASHTNATTVADVMSIVIRETMLDISPQEYTLPDDRLRIPYEDLRRNGMDTRWG